MEYPPFIDDFPSHKPPLSSGIFQPRHLESAQSSTKACHFEEGSSQDWAFQKD